VGIRRKKEASCDPLDPLDRLCGDDWTTPPSIREPVAPGLWCRATRRRDLRAVDRQVHDRTGGRTDLLITSDEHAPYETSIHEVYGVEQPGRDARGRAGRPKPVKVVPADLCYATVRKRREKGRVAEVVRTVVFGTLRLLGVLLGRSTASTTNQHVVRGAEQRDGPAPEFAEASQDVRVLEGPGDASSGVLLRGGTATTSAGRCGRCGSVVRRGRAASTPAMARRVE